MPFVLNKNLAKNLAEGSAVFSCGGGIEIEINRKKCVELAKNKKILIKSLSEFKKNDILGVISGVGKTVKQKYNFTEALKTGVKYIPKLLHGKKLAGIVPGEIGIESLILETAGNLGLPILDGDVAGGRAVPEIQDDIFYINKTRTTPVICVNLKKEVLIIDKTDEIRNIENLVRNFASLSRGPLILIDHISRRDNFKRISLATFSRSIRLGEKIKGKNEKERFSEILNFTKAKIIVEGRIVSIKEKNVENFLEKIIEGKNWKIIVKNEYIAVFINERLITAVPDIIVIIEKNTGKPLHSTQVKEGKDVSIISIKSFKKWYTKRGLMIFGPESMNLSRKTAS